MTKTEKGIIDAITLMIAFCFWFWILWLIKDPVLEAILSLIDFVVFLPLRLIFLPSEDLAYTKTLLDYTDVVYWVLFGFFLIFNIIVAASLIGCGIEEDKEKEKEINGGVSS